MRATSQPTPAAGLPVLAERQTTDDLTLEASSPTRAYPIALQPSQRRTTYLKELLPRLSRAGQDVASELDLGQLMATIMAELAHWTGCERARSASSRTSKV